MSYGRSLRRAGFDDVQYYVPVRSRGDTTYIPANGEYPLLFHPGWVDALVGDEMMETDCVR